ncbi:MAG: radical SAM protein [Clostridiaceae bacterium]|nr:radical SAM protein [Clostridiaceae bacterium]
MRYTKKSRGNKLKKRHINIPIFIPHKGCPHTCIFCDQRKISGFTTLQTPEKIEEIIKESLDTIEDSNNIEIAFFGGSFTGIPEKEMISFLQVAKSFVDNKKVHGIRLSTRPDYINPHIMDILGEYGVTAIELGVQSLDPDVLIASKRGHTVKDTIKSCNLIKERKISLGIQTMLGLPEDNFSKAVETAKSVVDLMPDMVRIYPALVLKNTELETLYNEGKFSPLTVEEAVLWCSEIVQIYKSASIKILRIGLHSSEILEGSIVAGPYHPAFGELVESQILLKRIIKELNILKLNRKITERSSIIIKTRPNLLSKVIGQNRSNISEIKEKFGINKIRIVSDIETKEFGIQITEC